jgi:hypothetical protein
MHSNGGRDLGFETISQRRATERGTRAALARRRSRGRVDRPR